MAADAPLILLVEDTADSRLVVTDFLEFRGYRVVTAEDGLEAVEKTRELRPDVVLMDLSLPKLDGLEATRRLKQDERTRDIPVLALTAHALAEARASALDAGCVDVITKPCPPPELERKIRPYLDSEPAEEGETP